MGRWSKEQKEFVIANSGMPHDELAAAIGKTEISVRSWLSHNGFRRPRQLAKGEYNVWTRDKVRTLQSLMRHFPDEIVAEKMGLSVCQVKLKIDSLVNDDPISSNPALQKNLDDIWDELFGKQTTYNYGTRRGAKN